MPQGVLRSQTQEEAVKATRPKTKLRETVERLAEFCRKEEELLADLKRTNPDPTHVFKRHTTVIASEGLVADIRRVLRATRG